MFGCCRASRTAILTPIRFISNLVSPSGLPSSPHPLSSHGSLQWEGGGEPVVAHWWWWGTILSWAGWDVDDGSTVVCPFRCIYRGLKRAPCPVGNVNLAYLQSLDEEEGVAYLIYRFNVYKWQLEEHECLDHHTASALRNLTGENRDGASVNMFHAGGAIDAVVSGHFGVSVAAWRGKKIKVMCMAVNPAFNSCAMVLVPKEPLWGVGHLSLDTTYLSPEVVNKLFLDQGGKLSAFPPNAEYAGKRGKGKSASAAPVVDAREACHSRASEVYSANAPYLLVKELKNATSRAAYDKAASQILPSLLSALRVATEGAHVVILFGVPDSTLNANSRLDPLLRLAATSMSSGGSQIVGVCSGLLTRVSAMATPAKSRPPLSSTIEADAAGRAEARTISMRDDALKAILKDYPGARLIVVDDIGSTATTLGGILEVLTRTFPDHVRKAVAIHTTHTLAGIAKLTLGPEASSAAMKSKLEEVQGRVGVTNKDLGGYAVYLRQLNYTHSQGVAVVKDIEGDTNANAWEVMWAREWREKNMAGEGGGGGGGGSGGTKKRKAGGAGGGLAPEKVYVASYVGQVHTLDKLVSTRYKEEDSGKDGTGLVYQLRLRFFKHGVTYKSQILLTSLQLQEVAEAGQTTIATATNWAERYFYDSYGASYKFGGINCLKPCPMVWGRMDLQLQLLVQAVVDSSPGSGAPGWSATAAGKAAVESAWGKKAVDICESNAGLLAHIQRRGGTEFSVSPTARELQSALKRFAG